MSASAVQLWHNAVALAGLPSTGHALSAQLSILEAIMHSDLRNHCLLEKIQPLAIQKGANTVADLLYLTFQALLPSEPSVRVEGLATFEAPVKPARTLVRHFPFYDHGASRSSQ